MEGDYVYGPVDCVCSVMFVLQCRGGAGGGDFRGNGDYVCSVVFLFWLMR